MVRLTIASLIFLAPLFLTRVPAIGLGVTAQGEIWQPFGLQGETVLALEVTGSGAERVVYAETRTGLWRDAAADGPGTPRGGQSWRRADAGLPVTPLGGPALAAWRTVPGRAAGLYALTGAGTARQIFRSDDGGDTWQLIGPAPGQIERPPMVVLAGANGAPDSITLAGDSRIQRSTDGGQTWVPGGAWPAPTSKAEPDRSGQPPTVRHTIHRLLGESNAPDRLYALADDGAFWLSESGGRAWRIISAPIAAPAVPGIASPAVSGIGGVSAGRPVTALALMPYFGVRIWATTADAIGFSTDNGANWTVQPLPPTTFGAHPGIGALLADPRVPETVYAALGQIVYRSDDSGATWTSLGYAGGGQITALALDPDTRSVLYAAGDDGVWMRRVVPIAPAALAEMPTAVPTETALPISNLQPPTSSLPTTPTETALPPTATPTPQPSPTPTPTVTASPSPTRTPTATRPPTATPPSPTAAPPTISPPVATATEPPPPPPTAEPRPTATPRPPTAEPPTAEPRPTTIPPPETPRPTPVPR